LENNLKINIMANCDNLFKGFNTNIQVPSTKKNSIKTSKDTLRDRIKKHFKEFHSDYAPSFYIQGSYKIKNTIRTKDDTCDLDDGVYFSSNPDNVTGTTLQKWVKEAVDGTTDATPSHRKKCITIDYKGGYNIDLPVFVYNKEVNQHPQLAVKDGNFQEDDPKEFVDEFNKIKDSDGQLLRITKYLKTWADFKDEKMPSGLSLTVLAMKHFQKNQRDDISLKFTLIEIENELKLPFSFKCVMPTTPKDDLFQGYTDSRKLNFLNNLAAFITDSKEAVDNEKNQLKASKLWRKHLGEKYFPLGEDEDEKSKDSANLAGVIGNARPYYGN
jgi:hypothetical protein